jgi:hypothetical protein
MGRGWWDVRRQTALTSAAQGVLVMRRRQQPRPTEGRSGFLIFPAIDDPANPAGMSCARVNPDQVPTPDHGSGTVSRDDAADKVHVNRECL